MPLGGLFIIGETQKVTYFCNQQRKYQGVNNYIGGSPPGVLREAQ